MFYEMRYITLHLMRLSFDFDKNQFFEVHHYSHIVDRNILKNRLLNNPQLLSKQIKYIRNIAQVNPIILMNHLNIQKN